MVLQMLRVLDYIKSKNKHSNCVTSFVLFLEETRETLIASCSLLFVAKRSEENRSGNSENCAVKPLEKNSLQCIVN